MTLNKKMSRFAFLLILISVKGWALESDAQQPIVIDSNTATYDDASATSTYVGNVISVQGIILVN